MREFEINGGRLRVAEGDLAHLLGVIEEARVVASEVHRNIYWGPHPSLQKSVLMASDGFTALVLPVDDAPVGGAQALPPNLFTEEHRDGFFLPQTANELGYPSISYLQLSTNEETWASLVPIEESGGGGISVVFEEHRMHVRRATAEALPGYCKGWRTHEIEYGGKTKWFDASLLAPAVKFTGATRIGLAANYAGFLQGDDGRFALVMPKAALHPPGATKHLRASIANLDWRTRWGEIHIAESLVSQHSAGWHAADPAVCSFWVRAKANSDARWVVETDIPGVEAATLDTIEEARHWARAAYCWVKSVAHTKSTHKE